MDFSKFRNEIFHPLHQMIFWIRSCEYIDHEQDERSNAPTTATVEVGANVSVLLESLEREKRTCIILNYYSLN